MLPGLLLYCNNTFIYRLRSQPLHHTSLDLVLCQHIGSDPLLGGHEWVQTPLGFVLQDMPTLFLTAVIRCYCCTCTNLAAAAFAVYCPQLAICLSTTDTLTSIRAVMHHCCSCTSSSASALAVCCQLLANQQTQVCLPLSQQSFAVVLVLIPLLFPYPKRP